MFSLSEKSAVVTGAGTGIGKAVAQILLRNNYAVTLTGRRQELLEKTAADSGADPEKIYCTYSFFHRDL